MQNLKFKIVSLIAAAFGLLFSAGPALAHVVVRPNEVGVGARTNFAVSVPTEEDVPTIQVRLLIPEGLQSVRPNVKPGWNIQLVKSGTGDDARISEIIWSGGSIPAEQRDEFVFSAQAQSQEGALQWKAYQTYQGGLVVAWDQDPKVVEEYSKNNPTPEEEDDHSAPKPFSVTKVINDLAASSAPVVTKTNQSIGAVSEDSNTWLALGLSALAVVLSVVSIAMQRRKNQA